MKLQQAQVILLVEADTVTRNQLTQLLRAEGHIVVATANGFQALSALATRPINLVICNEELPGLSGMSVLTTIRAREADAHQEPTPFVLMAVRTSPHLPSTDGFLCVPVEANQLIDMIPRRPGTPFRKGTKALETSHAP